MQREIKHMIVVKVTNVFSHKYHTGEIPYWYLFTKFSFKKCHNCEFVFFLNFMSLGLLTAILLRLLESGIFKTSWPFGPD